MKKRLVIAGAVALLLLVVGVAAAFMFGSRRDVTTSSDEAYRVYKEALENERRYYLREAHQGYAKALELDPQFAEAMLGLARGSEGDQGLMLVRRAAKQKDRLTEREQLHVDLQLAAREGRSEDRQAIAQKIHAKYPDDIRAATVLAEYEIQIGNTEKALAILAELLTVEPNNANAYNLIGYYHAYRGDYDKAIENLRKYQFMAPDQANPYDSLGEIQAYSGHYDEAIQNLNQALKLKPDFFASYEHLGVAYEGKGDYAKAIEAYEKGAKEAIDDEMRRAYLRAAARTAYVAGDVAAFKDLSARYRAVPGDKHPEIGRLVLDAAQDLMEKRPADAERRLREARAKIQEAYPKDVVKDVVKDAGMDAAQKFFDPAWTFLMAQALVAQGRADEAIVFCEQLANPPRPSRGFDERRLVYSGRALLAQLLAQKGDLDRAEKLLAENRKWNPSWAPTRQFEQAVAQLRREKVLAATK